MVISKVTYQTSHIEFDQETLKISITKDNVEWKWADSYQPYFFYQGEKIYFKEAKEKVHNTWKTGVGKGIRSRYGKFYIGNKELKLEIETIIWIEYSTEDIHFEIIPIVDQEGIGEIYWPGHMEFAEYQEDWYSVLNVLQGIILPNTWQHEVSKVNFEGQLCSTAAYMPWWGQIKPDGGYIAICNQPWDAAYQIKHPANGPYTYIGIRWLPSMGTINYKRTMTYSFISQCDYNDLCKRYRLYAKEKGLLVTLKEKAAKNPLVDKLIGSAIVHTGIKTHIAPESRYYNQEEPEKNDHMTSFYTRIEQIRKLKTKGLGKVYVHLDGWGEPGYDNQHPDYLPACRAAGGWEGMKALSDEMKALNYMFAIHDQYRDYYFDAKTFDREFAMRNVDGTIPDFSRWAGGHQTYLCASQAPLYVKRNFEELFQHGIKLEGTYLDVFTCNEGDECIHPWHRMSRKECFEYRLACFNYLLSRGILPSSEEVVDWAIPSLVLAHYGPYDFMLEPQDAPRKGIPTPLFNLVYHDCVVLPWLMDKKDKEDYMLYALLNGGAAYVNMEVEEELLEQEIARYREVAKVQEVVAKSEMLKHEFINKDYSRQKVIYDNGIEIEIDLKENSYKILNRH